MNLVMPITARGVAPASFRASWRRRIGSILVLVAMLAGSAALAPEAEAAVKNELAATAAPPSVKVIFDDVYRCGTYVYLDLALEGLELVTEPKTLDIFNIRMYLSDQSSVFNLPPASAVDASYNGPEVKMVRDNPGFLLPTTLNGTGWYANPNLPENRIISVNNFGNSPVKAPNLGQVVELATVKVAVNQGQWDTDFTIELADADGFPQSFVGYMNAGTFETQEFTVASDFSSTVRDVPFKRVRGCEKWKP